MTPRLIRTFVAASIAAVLLVLSPGALAASEQGDAGDLRASAQDLGDEAVVTIDGTFVDAADADMYRICLTDGASFSASTVGATTLDTQLFLLTPDGHGVYANDDWNGSRGSRLPAGHRFSPTSGGEHYLAISSFNRDPESAQGEIFQDDFSRTLYPDGVLDANGFGGEGAHSGWHGRASGSAGVYRITLTGARVCVPPDTTPPTIDLRSPADGARVGRGADVVVDFSCADEGGSGIESCVGTTADGAKLDTSALGDVGVTVTARDVAGNETVATHTLTVVDETPPRIALDSPASGGEYELGERVVADYSCSDEAGGSGLATCTGTVPDGAAIDTAGVGRKSFTVEAADNAGNPASTTVSYSVVDRTAPSISLTTPADGAVYTLGQSVPAAYSCEDQPGGAGVATCEGDVANGAAIDTSSVGTHSFAVRAADHAGNADSRTVAYSVVYSFHGFLSPVQNPPKANRWKAGVPVPIRFSLDGYRGPRPEADGYPRSVPCGGEDGQQVTRAARKKPVFEYDRRTDRYALRWKTERRWAGSCREFVLRLDDGSVHTARFEFVKRRPRDGDDDG